LDDDITGDAAVGDMGEKLVTDDIEVRGELS
jgi:hypothetical protein